MRIYGSLSFLWNIFVAYAKQKAVYRPSQRILFVTKPHKEIGRVLSLASQ